MRLIGCAVVVGAGQARAVGLGRVFWAARRCRVGEGADRVRSAAAVPDVRMRRERRMRTARAGHDRCGRGLGVDALTLTGTGQQPVSKNADKNFENCDDINIFHHYSARSGI